MQQQQHHEMKSPSSLSLNNNNNNNNNNGGSSSSSLDHHLNSACKWGRVGPHHYLYGASEAAAAVAGTATEVSAWHHPSAPHHQYYPSPYPSPYHHHHHHHQTHQWVFCSTTTPSMRAHSLTHYNHFISFHFFNCWNHIFACTHFFFVFFLFLFIFIIFFFFVIILKIPKTINFY